MGIWKVLYMFKNNFSVLKNPHASGKSLIGRCLPTASGSSRGVTQPGDIKMDEKAGKLKYEQTMQT